MHFVLIAEHNAEVCPTSNAATRKLMQQNAPNIPSIAEKAGVTIVSGPYVNREHTTVAVVQAATAEAVDQFLVDSRLHQWNRVRVLPSIPLQEVMADIDRAAAVF